MHEPNVARDPDELESADEGLEIRYSLTALGEAVLNDRRGPRFKGFGPCALAVA